MTTPWSAADAADAERRYGLGLALTPRQVAHILGLVHARGEQRGRPDRLRAMALVDAGRLRPVDPTQPPGRVTVSAAEVRRYLDGDNTPLAPLHLLEETA